MACLNRETLLSKKAKEVPRERVEIPELGGHVWVRGMSGIERGEWEASLTKGRGSKARPNTRNGRASMLVRCVVDDDWNRILTNADAEELGKSRVDILNRLFNIANRLSGSDEEELDELGQDSGEAHSGDSSST